jgi:hypothetical protein
MQVRDGRSHVARWVIEHTIAYGQCYTLVGAAGDGDAMRASLTDPVHEDDPLEPNALDFWVGRWMVSWAEGGHGTNTVRRILDDMLIEESFDGHEGGSSLRGRSLSVREGDRLPAGLKDQLSDGHVSRIAPQPPARVHGICGSEASDEGKCCRGRVDGRVPAVLEKR